MLCPYSWLLEFKQEIEYSFLRIAGTFTIELGSRVNSQSLVVIGISRTSIEHQTELEIESPESRESNRLELRRIVKKRRTT